MTFSRRKSQTGGYSSSRTVYIQMDTHTSHFKPKIPVRE